MGTSRLTYEQITNGTDESFETQPSSGTSFDHTKNKIIKKQKESCKQRACSSEIFCQCKSRSKCKTNKCPCRLNRITCTYRCNCSHWTCKNLVPRKSRQEQLREAKTRAMRDPVKADTIRAQRRKSMKQSRDKISNATRLCTKHRKEKQPEDISFDVLCDCSRRGKCKTKKEKQYGKQRTCSSEIFCQCKSRSKCKTNKCPCRHNRITCTYRCNCSHWTCKNLVPRKSRQEQLREAKTRAMRDPEKADTIRAQRRKSMKQSRDKISIDTRLGSKHRKEKQLEDIPLDIHCDCSRRGKCKTKTCLCRKMGIICNMACRCRSHLCQNKVSVHTLYCKIF